MKNVFLWKPSMFPKKNQLQSSFICLKIPLENPFIMISIIYNFMNKFLLAPKTVNFSKML